MNTADVRPPPSEPAAPPLPAPSTELVRSVEQARPVRTRRPWRTFLIVLPVSIAHAGVWLVWAIGLRSDLATVPRLPLLLYGLLSLASFAVNLALALLPARGDVFPAGHRSLRLPMLLLALTAPVGLLLGTLSSAFHPAPEAGGSGEADGTVADPVAKAPRFGNAALACLVSGLGVAALPTLLVLVALRRLLPLGAWRAAVAVAAGAGALAGFTLELHCPATLASSPGHLLLGHGLAMVGPALLLIGLGRRLSRR